MEKRACRKPVAGAAQPDLGGLRREPFQDHLLRDRARFEATREHFVVDLLS